MKAAILETIPGELVVDELEVRAPAAREVLIRTAASGLCHSDLHFMEGLYQCPVPAVLGHECSGVVEAGCKTVIGGRCKGSGMRWSRVGLERLLPIRAAIMSHRFDDLWQKVYHLPPN